MLKIGRFLALGLIALGMGKGQSTPPSSLQISQQPLPIVQGVSAIYTGPVGQTTFYYFVVAKYGVGDANVSQAVAVGGINPAGGGSVAISWGAPANPSGYSLTYDVLRSTSQQFPGTCNCLVSGAQAGNTATDSLGVLSSYSANAYNPFAPINLTIDNVNAKEVLLKGIVNGANILQPFVFPTTLAGSGDRWIQPNASNVRGLFGIAPSGKSTISEFLAANSSDLNNFGYIGLVVSGLSAALNLSNEGAGIAPTSLNIDIGGSTVCTFTASGLSGTGCGGYTPPCTTANTIFGNFGASTPSCYTLTGSGTIAVMQTSPTFLGLVSLGNNGVVLNPNYYATGDLLIQVNSDSLLYLLPPNLVLQNNSTYSFSSTTNPAGVIDTSISRVSEGLVGINGGIESEGTKFTLSGCTYETTVGGATVGSFHSGTTGTCTVVITFNGDTGLTATNGWQCSASDTTTVADVVHQIAPISKTQATLSGTTVSGDVITFACFAY